MSKNLINVKNNTKSELGGDSIIFFIIMILLIILWITILFSKVHIEISNFKMQLPKKENRIVNETYNVKIKIYLLKVIKILNLEITKEKIERAKKNKKYQNIERNITINKNNYEFMTLKIIKKLNIKIKKLNLIIDLGTEDAASTSYLIAIIASILGIYLKNKIQNQNMQKFIVNPLYINQNLLKMNLNCIFEFKMIHIIYIIYILSKNKKERGNKNVRTTSNRRPYGYSYE